MKPKTYRKLTLLCLIFLAACDLNTVPDNILIIEPPISSFSLSVKGKVNNDRMEGLPGMCIKVPCLRYHLPASTSRMPDSTFYTETVNDTIYTTTDGSFKWNRAIFYADTIQIRLQFSDPDLSPPHYLPDTLQILLIDEDWKSGNLQKEITVFLKQH